MSTTDAWVFKAFYRGDKKDENARKRRKICENARKRSNKGRIAPVLDAFFGGIRPLLGGVLFNKINKIAPEIPIKDEKDAVFRAISYYIHTCVNNIYNVLYVLYVLYWKRTLKDKQFQ